MSIRAVTKAITLLALCACATQAAEFPARFAPPLKFHDEAVEVTAEGTLRRRFMVWGDYVAEVAAWKAKAEKAALGSESCAVLHTTTGHWLIVRPEVAEVFVEMHLRNGGAPLQAAGWLNEGVRPLLVLRAPPELAVPEKEIGYFR